MVPKQFWAKVYKTDKAFYAAGLSMALSCHFINEGTYGLNLEGQIVALPGSSIPASPAPQIGLPAVEVAQGTVFPDTVQAGLGLISVVKIKDTVAQQVYYVDAADYAANVVQCNPFTGTCQVPTGLQITGLASTSVRISWDAKSGISGIEYANIQQSSPIQPIGDGAFVATGTTMVSLSGLSSAKKYYFWIRTVCAAGSKSPWTSIAYVTA